MQGLLAIGSRGNAVSRRGNDDKVGGLLKFTGPKGVKLVRVVVYW